MHDFVHWNCNIIEQYFIAHLKIYFKQIYSYSLQFIRNLLGYPVHEKLILFITFLCKICFYTAKLGMLI